MLDFGFDKIALIGAVALIVIGPEKLPRVARTVGTLLGKAQRYVADVKAEVNRSIELEELQKMKSQFQTAVHDVEQSVRQEVNSATQAFDQTWRDVSGDSSHDVSTIAPPPQYRHPKKNWRLKRGATPLWYKQRTGVKRHSQSGAARVARFRPPQR
ncbi:MAG: Sec-independent protein translocase subunit TatB [Burkholderiales bacterium]|nr:Sec-independent protein translocase subunit TatB [Burkholderiales bacterium]